MLVAEHGLQYLLGPTILTGIIQNHHVSLEISLMKFVSRSVMTGFVNAYRSTIRYLELLKTVDIIDYV